MATEAQLRRILAQRGIQWATHTVVLLLSIVLIIMISLDTFRNVSFYQEPTFQKWQFWICVVFMIDFFIEFILADRKWRYLATNIVFFLVSIPYQAIIEYFGIKLPDEVAYLIRYMPLIRGGYAMAYVISWFTSNKATGLFLSYIIVMLSTVYFSSLTFYLFEHHVNPLVTKYLDALWWAAMAVTTEGSDITAITGVGKALSVLLASMGIIMFPVFTVYVTNVINRKQQQSNAQSKFISAYRRVMDNKKQNLTKATVSGHKTGAIPASGALPHPDASATK